MTDREAWIASIIADPKNDLRRLVFADWLDEHDEPERAEFIRVMCRIQELANEMCGQCHDRLAGRQHTNGPCRCTPRIKSLVRREQELYVDHCEEWHKPDGAEYTWKRGFVSEVRCPLSVWLEHGPRLVREHPIEVVRATDRRPTSISRISNQLGVPGQHSDYGFQSAHYNNPRHQLFYELPEGVFGLLPDAYYSPNQFRKYWRTKDEATKALSHALIEWAKSQSVPAAESAIG